MMASFTIVIACLTTTALCFSEPSRSENDILGLALPTPEPLLDGNTVCRTYPGLTARQMRLCHRYTDVMASAIQGVQVAVYECQHQFAGHRWNCSSMEAKNKNPTAAGNTILTRGFRETAFASSITAAGMSVQVSRACALGKLAECGCKQQFYEEAGVWLWRGCEHTVDFGDWFARKMDAAKDKAPRDHQAKFLSHNARVGRQVVLELAQTTCKCLGMSGSCATRTCWKTAPAIRAVGNNLKEKYLSAKKLTSDNTAKVRLQQQSNNKWKRKRRKSPGNTASLIYFENSPSFCDYEPAVDSWGTTGRVCNSSWTGSGGELQQGQGQGHGSCAALCCGRGHSTMRMTRTERCDCRFHWCCYVICKNCTRTDWLTVCK